MIHMLYISELNKPLCQSFQIPVKEINMKTLNRQSWLLILAISLLIIAPVNATTPKPQKCVANNDCANNEFCDTTPNCQDGKSAGVCLEKPQFCAMDYVPVKACDGKTY